MGINLNLLRRGAVTIYNEGNKQQSKLNEVYFDNGATTKVSQTAAKKVMHLLTENFGNPSSLHTKGINAQNEMDYARRIIADKLAASAGEIVFTSGGTEANNLAVVGTAYSRKRMGNRIVTSAIEHSSVMSACKHLEENGFDVVYLMPNEKGTISLSDLENAINEKTILVTLMYVNNETGAVLPVEKVSRIIKIKNAPAVFHCDAVQAFGKFPFTVSKIKADLLSITAHKIHGPKGVGALYIKKGVRVQPLHFGGSQENSFRPGTQAVPLIGGFGEAAAEIDYTAREKVQGIREYLKDELKKFDDIVLHDVEPFMPYILNFSVVGIKSETMLHFLAQNNIFVSSGSACSKGKASHVLKAMGIAGKELDGAIRISFSKNSNIEQAQRFLEVLKQGVKTLARA